MPRPIFLAAPEAGDAAIGLIDKLFVQLEIASNGALKGSDVYVPHLQIGDVGIDATADAYFTKSLTTLQEARVIVAVLDGAQVDENVAFFLGYAFAAQKPVIAYATDGRKKGPLVDGVIAETVHDVRALVAALKRALA